MTLFKQSFAAAKATISALLLLGLLQMIPTVAVSQSELNYLTPLLEKAQEDGTVRIIVKLDVPVRPQGNLSPAQRLAQRNRIRNVQNDFINRIDQFWWQNPAMFETIPFISVEVDEDSLVAAATFPRTVAIMEDRLLKPDQLDARFLAPELSQSIPLIGGVNGEFNGFTGAGQAVAILDTGVDNDHTFFPGGKVVREACFSTTGSGGTTVCPNGQQSQIGTGAGNHCDLSIDGCDHGTHVAGIAAGNSASFSGVAKDADIIAVQVFSRFTGAICNPGPSPCALAFTSDIILGLEHVLDLHNDAGFSTPIAAANLSLGGGLTGSPCPGEPEQTAIVNLRSVGIATVIASGNDGVNNQISFPACIPEAVSVGSTTKSDNISSFSNRDDFLDLMAPGSLIESSIPNDNFAFFNGTSMATPHVAGAFTVMHEADPGSTVQEKLDALQNTGVDITDSATGFVYQRIQLDNAIDQLNPAPVIVSFTADDPDDGDTVYAAGDTLTITFDIDTNQPSGTPSQLFNFSDSLGNSVNGSWTSANTYVITVVDATGNGVSLGTTTATPTGAGGFEIRDAAAASDPSSATSPTLSGDFGLQDVVWTNDVNVQISGNDLVMTGGSNWSGGASSVQMLNSGDGFVESTVNETGTRRMFGLSKGDSTQHFSEIDFALFLHHTNALKVYENGVLRSETAAGFYQSGDVVRVEVSGTQVLYKHNGSVFYTSTETVGAGNYPMLVDASLRTAGNTLMDVQVSGFSPPPPPAAPVITSFEANDPDDGDTVYSAGDTLTIMFDVGTNEPSGTPAQLFNFSDSLGNSVNGSWTSANTYVITVVDATGNGVSLGATTATPTGAGGFEIRDAGGTSDPSSATSPTLSGDFGSALEDVVWTNGVNVQITGNDLTMTGGSNWSGGASSVQMLNSGDGFVESTVNETGTRRMFGLSKGDSTQHFSEIDFALFLHHTNALKVYENGVLRSETAAGFYQSGDVVRVEVSGTQVLYKHNGSVFYTSTETVSAGNYPMLVDASLRTAGNTLIDVQVSGFSPPPPPAAPVITSFEADDPDDGDTVYSAGDTLTVTFDVGTNEPSGTPAQLFNFSDSLGNSVNGSWTSANTYVITVVDATGNGVSLGTTTATPTGAGGFEIRDAGGTSDPSSATSPTLSGDFGLQDVVWTNGVNVQITGNDLTMTGGSNWSGGASSVQMLNSGDGFVESTVNETGTRRMFGLSKGDSTQHFSEIDFALFLHHTNALKVYENGVLRSETAAGFYQSGDVVRVEVSGTQVLYKHNGSVFYTSTETVSAGNYPMLVDTSLRTAGNTLIDVQVSGFSPPPPPAAPVITSFEADDPDDGDTVYSAGDTLTVTFDVGTNEPSGTPAQLFNFSDSLGNSVNGSWTSANTYVITVVDATGNGVSLGTTTATPTGAGGFEIRDAGGTSDPSSATSPTLSGDFGSALEDVVWTNDVNVQITGNDLTMTGGSNWSGGASSVQMLNSGDGFVESTVNETGTRRMIGLSKGDSIQHFSEIDFALFLHHTNALKVYENGVLRSETAAGFYQSGDVVRVEVSGTQVLYKHNGSVFYTSTETVGAGNYPMLVDASLRSSGNTLIDVKVSGFSPPPPSGRPNSNTATKLKISTDSQSFVAGGALTGITFSATFLNDDGTEVSVTSGTEVTFTSSVFADQSAFTTGGAKASASVVFSAPIEPEAVVVTAQTSLAGVDGDTLTLFFNEPGVRATQVAESNFATAGTHTLLVNTQGIRSISITKGAGITPVTTAKFDHNPAGPAPFNALGFYDVHLDNPAGVTQLVIEFCPGTMPPGVFFWKNGAWKSVSNQRAVNDCVKVTVNQNTFPNLDDLSGQFFGVGANATGGDPPIWENIMAFPTPEKSLGKDLNSDGDLLDTILRYQDVSTGVITNTGIAVSGRHRDVDIYEDTIVFVEESQHRANVVSTYNIKTGELRSTGVIGYRPTIHGNLVSISGDTVRFYNLDTGVLTDTGIPGHIQSLWGNVIAYHRAVTKTAHPTIRYFNTETGTVTNTKVAGHYPAIYENWIVFTTDERLIREDLSGDGDARDSVVRYYDISTGTLFNTGEVGAYPMIHNDRIVFSTNREIRYFDINLQQTFSTGQLGTEPDIFADTITYYLWEKWPTEDLNGDGDQSDPIVRTYVIDAANHSEDAAIDATPPTLTPLSVHAVQNYPNPVGEHGLMTFVVEGEGIRSFHINVYDLAGNPVFDSGFRVGQQLQWDLANNQQPVANGVYLYVTRVRGLDGSEIRSQVKKLIVLR